MADPDPLFLAWPPSVLTLPDGSQTFETVVSDSDDDIRQSVFLLAGVRVGTLATSRDRGIPSPLARSDPDDAARLIEAALRDQEPRATRITVRVIEQDDQPRAIRLKVTP